MRLPIRVLVICSANSARSQIAEALFRARGATRIVVESSGTTPAEQVNPGALRVLAAHGVRADGQRPKQIGEVLGRGWDVVITVCDQAAEACPVLPDATLSAHWGVADPAGALDEDAFEQTFQILSRRVDALLSLPLERLDGGQLRGELRRIGNEGSAAE